MTHFSFAQVDDAVFLVLEHHDPDLPATCLATCDTAEEALRIVHALAVVSGGLRLLTSSVMTD